jgi:hypothetical protein
MKTNFLNIALTYLVLAAFTLVGCAKQTGSSSSTSTAASSSASSTAGILNITQFNPANGSTLSALPSTIVAEFSESNLDTGSDSGSVNNTTNYMLQCGSSESYALSVTYDGSGDATLTFPTETIANGTECIFTVSTTIQDTNGNPLQGSNAATFTINSTSTGSGTSSSLSVSSFSPATGTVSSLPAEVAITFNETNLDTTGGANSELNVSNYTLTCNSTNYSVLNVSQTSSSTILVDLPTESLSSGATCTLSLSPNLNDNEGNELGTAPGVTYTLVTNSSSNTTWNEASSPSFTSTVGNNSIGSYFLDTTGSNFGIALAGLNIHAGAYIDQITGIWTQAFNSSSSITYGPSHGGNGGSALGNMTCPSGMQMTGLYGTYDNQIDSIGIVCSTVDGSETYQAGAIGGSGGQTFQISCPSGTFATDLEGTISSYVQTLSLGCR